MVVGYCGRVLGQGREGQVRVSHKQEGQGRLNGIYKEVVQTSDIAIERS